MSGLEEEEEGVKPRLVKLLRNCKDDEVRSSRESPRFSGCPVGRIPVRGAFTFTIMEPNKRAKCTEESPRAWPAPERREDQELRYIFIPDANHLN